MEWPPDVEGKVFELIRPHAQCGLKRRTWKAIYDQLLATVPRKVIHWCHLRLCFTDNEAQPIDDDRTFQIFNGQDALGIGTMGMWQLNPIELDKLVKK